MGTEPFGRQEQFESALALVGKRVEVGLADKVIRGCVINAMFDSILIESESGLKTPIHFGEMNFLRAVE